MRRESTPKVAWIVSLPRSGSMWTFNLTRQLASTAGFDVQPKEIPQSDQQMMAGYVHGAKDDGDAGRLWVLKSHRLPALTDPRVVYINPRRDVRDALISFMRFMHYDFESALGMARAAANFEQRINSQPNERTLILDYRQIVRRPETVAREIADFLGLSIPDNTVSEVVASLSKEKVAARIKSVETSIRHREEAGQPVRDTELVRDVSSGWERAFDIETGFQSGHVSDYRDGDWRHILTPEQQAVLDENSWTFGFLLRPHRVTFRYPGARCSSPTRS